MEPRRLNELLTLIVNFGVIAGLIFLGLEIRQNTIATQASAIQESTNVARQQLLMFATNPDLVELGFKDLNELNEVEVARVLWVSRSFWLGMQGLWRQWKMGVLPSEEWEMWNQIICMNYAGDDFWPQQILIPSFVELVESCELPE